MRKPNRINININHIYCQHSSSYVSFNQCNDITNVIDAIDVIDSDSVLTNLLGSRLNNVIKHLPHHVSTVTPSI